VRWDFVPEDVGVFGNVSGPLRGISNVTGRRRCREEYRLAFGLAAVAFSGVGWHYDRGLGSFG